ncbi:hypothetical protein BV898_13077 [Hypsibius exemplaris]|uniref:RIIa domain-containing protein n=1 Tax=Hypsibius exemplaris TaxID=2072580 RepID=A0A1W0WBW6_HYPEX|nr:hypothetical protein BV898_13077 [Hypsibius exemplaris]
MPHRHRSEDNIDDGEESHGSFQSVKALGGKPSRTIVTIAPKIYASAYSDDVWVMLKDYTKEVLRNSPGDVLSWSSDYFARKVDERRKSAADYAIVSERNKKEHNHGQAPRGLGPHQVSRESQHEELDIELSVSDEERDHHHGDPHSEHH